MQPPATTTGSALPTRAGAARSRTFATIGVSVTILSTVALLPGAMDRWVLPKVAVAVVGAVIASLAPRTGRIPRPVGILLAVGALLLVICALVGATPFAQLLGRWPRYEGLVTLPAYFAALWTAARSVGPLAGRARYETVYAAAAVVSAAVGVVSILESAGLRPLPSDLARPGSLLGNASDQGVVGVLCFGVLAAAALFRVGSGGSAFRRWYPAVGAALGAITVVLSESRAALLALVVVAVFAIVIVAIRVREHRRLMIVVLGVGVAALVVLTLALPGVRNRVFSGGTFLGGFGHDRGSLWQETLRLIAAHPLFGVGPSGFIDALPAYTTPTWFATTGLGVTTDSPHSVFLQAAVAGGIPLLLVALAIVVFAAVRAVRTIRGPENEGHRELVLGSFLALAGFGIALLATFTAPATTILAAFLVGIVLSDPPTRVAAAHSRGWVPVARTTLLSIWAIAILLTTTAEIPLEAGTQDASQGRVTASIDQFAAARALRPWDSDITLIEAQSLTAAAARKVPDAVGPALRWARVAHSELPSSVLGAKALAAAQELDGQLASATKTAAALNAAAPNDPETLARLGLLYAKRGLLAKAQPILERTVRLSPRDTASWNALGYVYQQLGNTSGVARVTAALARLKPNG
jgi:Flp pilus assembly protein TadD